MSRTRPAVRFGRLGWRFGRSEGLAEFVQGHFGSAETRESASTLAFSAHFIPCETEIERTVISLAPRGTEWQNSHPTLMSSAPGVEPQSHAYQVFRYGPHESVPISKSVVIGAAQNPAALPGDFILTHSSGIYGRLIRLGEAIRYRGAEKVFAHWSHAAIFINDAGDIIEALGGGVQQRNISVYDATEYVVVHLPATTAPGDRMHAVAFADFCLNDKYGWLTIVSIALCLLTGAKLSFGVDGQQICSGLVARSSERIGEIFTEGDPWQLMPADLAKHFNVRSIGERGQPPHPDSGVTHFSRPGKRQR